MTDHSTAIAQLDDPPAAVRSSRAAAMGRTALVQISRPVSSPAIVPFFPEVRS